MNLFGFDAAETEAIQRRNMIIGVVSTVSAALSGYHGYRRNQSIGWGVAWFLLGGLAPVLTPTIAFAQGFGERKKG